MGFDEDRLRGALLRKVSTDLGEVRKLIALDILSRSEERRKDRELQDGSRCPVCGNIVIAGHPFCPGPKRDLRLLPVEPFEIKQRSDFPLSTKRPKTPHPLNQILKNSGVTPEIFQRLARGLHVSRDLLYFVLDEVREGPSLQDHGVAGDLD